MDPLSITAGTAGLIQLTESIFTRSLAFAQSVRKYEKSLSRFQAEFVGLSNTLRSVYNAADALGSDRNASRAALLQLLAEIKPELGAIAERLHLAPVSGRTSRPSWLTKRLGWPFSEKESVAIITKVQRYTSLLTVILAAEGLVARTSLQSDVKSLMLASQRIEYSMGQRSAAQPRLNALHTDDALLARFSLLPQASQRVFWEAQREELRRFVDSEEKNILRLLIDLDLKNRKRLLDKLEMLHPEPHEALLNSHEYQSWMDGSEKALYILGVGGTGKTILAAEFVRAWSLRTKPNEVVVSFFCSFRLNIDVIGILTSIASQISQASEKAQDLAKKFVLEHKDGDGLSADAQDIQDLIVQMSLKFGRVTVILDGVDETGPTEHRNAKGAARAPPTR